MLRDWEIGPDGIHNRIHLDHEGALTFERIQDVEPILEHNKRLYTMNDGYTPSRDFRRVASIPMTVVEQWMREGINIFDKNCAPAIRRKLNDPQWLYLRTAPGRV